MFFLFLYSIVRRFVYLKQKKINSKGNITGFKALKKNKGPKKPAVKFTFLVIKILLAIIVLTFLISAGVIVGAVLGLINKTPAITADQLSLTMINSFIYDSSGKNVIGELKGEQNRVVVKHSDIPDYMREAFISIEDERFYSHNGVDFKRFAGAALSYVINFGHADYGGSTITQQLVKNITLNKQDSVPRKIQEAWQAMQLEKLVNNKDDILDNYMNRITTGINVYGVQAASKKYFGKDVKDLTLAECASIAGITKNPSRYSPTNEKWQAENIKRQRVILSKMYELGYVSKSDYEAALAQKLVFTTSSNTTATKPKVVFSYFVDQVIDDVSADLAAKKGITKDEATLELNNRGYKIYSTMDMNVQKEVDKVFTNDHYFPSPIVNGQHPQAAIVITDPWSGEVKGMYGGYGEKKASRILNRATQSKRQPGSSLKPIAVYGPSIDTGLITASTVIDDAPVHLNYQNKADLYPKNFTGYYSGLTTIKDAIKASVNVVASKVWMNLGPDLSLKYLKDDGIDLNKSEDGNVSIAMGGLTHGVSPLSMAAAYNPFASDGEYKEPITYTKVLDSEGNVILEKKLLQNKKIVYKEETAFIMTNMLKAVCNSSGGTAYYPNDYIDEHRGEILGQIQGGKMPTAGKTGTTSADKDRWFMGYSPYYVAAVWYGYDSPETVKLSSGYNPSLIIWHSVMQEIHRNLVPKDFPTPLNIVKRKVCIDSGKTPTDLCYHDPRGPRVRNESFIKNTEPSSSDYCQVHVKASVYKNTKETSGKYLLAGSSLPLSSVIERIFINRTTPYVRLYPNDPFPLDWKYELPTKYYEGSGNNLVSPTPTVDESPTPDLLGPEYFNTNGNTDSTNGSDGNSTDTNNQNDGTNEVIIPDNSGQNSGSELIGVN